MGSGAQRTGWSGGRSKRITALVWLGALLGGGCGASTEPDLNQVGHLFYTAYCAKQHQCTDVNTGTGGTNSAFLGSFPGGESECVDLNFKEIDQLSSMRSVCGLDQWQQCVQDMVTTTCSSKTLADGSVIWGPHVPDSCNGC